MVIVVVLPNDSALFLYANKDLDRKQELVGAEYTHRPPTAESALSLFDITSKMFLQKWGEEKEHEARKVNKKKTSEVDMNIKQVGKYGRGGVDHVVDGRRREQKRLSTTTTTITSASC